MLEGERALGLEELDRHRENQREAALASLLANRVVDKQAADALLGYWKLNQRKAEEYEEQGAVKVLVDKLKHDVELLRELRLRLKLQRKDPIAQQQEPAVSHLLRLLELILEKLERRWWLLRGRFWALYAAMNPAMPKKHLLHDKERQKEKAQMQPLEKDRKKDDVDT